ncbi:MAG: hypothetical protein ACD_41C00368G0006 [uncultured bacterium]|nr:MAG: hypothetical protein ACD_41C00368G0006 [uncultured bacterium]
MYQVSVDSTIFTVWPEAALGLVYATNINNRADTSAFATEARGIEVAVRERFPTAEAVGQHPNIQAWRKAYRAFGCDPHKYRCSSEAIVRQVLKGNTVWGINPLVDCYNYISLKYTVPVGGEDCAKIVGNVVLKRASGTEPFVRLGGSENEPPEVGEVIYADDAGVLCRRWNWREADRTKLTTDTTIAILVIEAIPPMTIDALQQATTELAELVQRWTGATVQSRIITMAGEPVATFDSGSVKS